MMFQLTPTLSVNTDLIKTVGIETRFYMNGSTSWLAIEFIDGTAPMRVDHGFGVDIFALKEKIEEAMR